MLPAEKPVLTCLPKGPVEATSLETLRAEQCFNMTELQTVVGNTHKEVAATADHLREYKSSACAKPTNQCATDQL
jgi:hypothetical protein